MKKILAVLLALAMMTACAAGDNSGAQSSTADGSGSEGSAYSEKSEDSSKESSSEQSHSSQQSGDPVPGEAGNTSGKTSSGSGSYSETSSAPEIISGSPIEPIIPGGSLSSGGNVEIINSYVRRVATIKNGDRLIWYHAANEQTIESDKPFVLLTNMNELSSFLMDMDGLYFQSYEENSAGAILKGYDEAFFEENVIILTHIQSNSGSVRYTVTGINVSGGLCTMNISAEMPEIGTADMADWFIFVEVPKDAVSGCSSYKMNIGF